MAGTRSAWSRIGAVLGLEVSAETLEAYRRARVLVHELEREVEDRRLACVLDGVDPWSTPPALRAGFLCAWNAIALQALGDAMLEADADGSPWTAGHVPEITRNEIEAYYGEVQLWADLAHQAFANPDFRLGVVVPGELPEPERRALVTPLRARDMHLWSVLAGMRALQGLAEAALASFPETAADPARLTQVHAIRTRFDRARDAARRAQRLYDGAPRLDVARVLVHARIAIRRFYELGQLIAAPHLVAGLREDPEFLPPPGPASQAGPARHLGPRRPTIPEPPDPPRAAENGEAADDPWCLTDPLARRSGTADLEALRRMWAADPARARALHEAVRAALVRGDVAYASPGDPRVPYWARCPWGSVYVARRTVHIDGLRVPENQRFVLDADLDAATPPHLTCRLVEVPTRSAEPAPKGRPKRRR